MAMPWQLVEELWERHARRKAAEDIRSLRNAMIGGLWGNSNYDPQKEGAEAPRTKALREMNERFDEAIAVVLGHRQPVEVDLKNDPFFAAMKLPGQVDRLAEPLGG
jgi:hypothetical protein